MADEETIEQEPVKDEPKQKVIAPDRISDVAEWGDRETNTRLFGEMDDDYLRRVEERAKALPTPAIYRHDEEVDDLPDE